MDARWKRAQQVSALVITSRCAGTGDSRLSANMAREVNVVMSAVARKIRSQKAIASVTTSKCVDMDDLLLSASVYMGERYAMCPVVKSDTHLVASVRSIT